MKIIQSLADMQSTALRLRQAGKTLGFVPTMGNLHAGHEALIRRARHENQQVVVSIFVNPLQFGPKEDFKKYPRTLRQDLRLLKTNKVDILFTPSPAEMYPKGFETTIAVPSLSAGLCGAYRPGHFQGVSTVVAKLFALVRPTRAYFGEKDYQQLRIIDQMTRDLRLPVHVIGCPTVRERDGLACSSRNQYLSPRERDEAVKLYQALYLGRELVEQRIMNDAGEITRRLKHVLSTIPKSKIDYISIVDPITLASMQKVRRPALLAVAVWIGTTRLIDNIIIS